MVHCGTNWGRLDVLLLVLGKSCGSRCRGSCPRKSQVNSLIIIQPKMLRLKVWSHMTRIGIDTTTYILHRENIYYCLTCTLVEKTIICKEKIALKVIRLLRFFRNSKDEKNKIGNMFFSNWPQNHDDCFKDFGYVEKIQISMECLFQIHCWHARIRWSKISRIGDAIWLRLRFDVHQWQFAMQMVIERLR